MKTIYKYPLEIVDKQTFMVPEKHRVLSMQLQDQRMCLWLMVDTESQSLPFDIEIYGTGTEIQDPEGLQHIDSVQIGPYVWHVFYRLTFGRSSL